jgi:hypothetical protein
LQPVVLDLQRRRAEVTDEVLREFMRIRPLEF